jgi:hypothetical protein
MISFQSYDFVFVLMLLIFFVCVVFFAMPFFITPHGGQVLCYNEVEEIGDDHRVLIVTAENVQAVTSKKKIAVALTRIVDSELSFKG